MSVIKSIRERYAKLAGFVIALALVGFIMMDAFSGGPNSLFGGSNYVAKVNGEKIEYPEYEQRVRDYEFLYEIFNRGQQPDEATRTQLREQALQELVMEKIMAPDVEKLGLTVSQQEIKDMTVGANPEQAVQQFPYFINQQTGQFDPAGIAQFEAEVRKQSNVPEVAKAGAQWKALKDFLVRQRLVQKYSALMGTAAYVPQFMANRMAEDAGKTAGIRYVSIPVATVNDNEVKVSDQEMKDYMKKRAPLFTAKEKSRHIDYIVFTVAPDAADTARALGELQKTREDFATTADVENFVNRNSEDRYSDQYVTRNTFMNPFSDSILNQPVGSVFGPYFDNGSYKMSKLVATRNQPDSVKAQHILIAFDQNTDDSAAHKRADSLLTAVQQGASFDSLARQFSADQGSAAQGGDLGYFPYGVMVPEFNEFVFEGKNGDMKVVKTQFGYHVIRINDQKSFQPAYKIATVRKSLNIGDAAEQQAFSAANKFAAENNDGKKFEAALKSGAFNKFSANVRPADFQIEGMDNAREMVRWVYDNKVGAVSEPMKMGEDRYVVAHITSEQNKGLVDITDDIRPQLENLVRNQKKLDVIANKYKDQKNLDAIAAASGQQVLMADSLNASVNFSQAFGNEPKVVGYSFYPKFEINATSPAIKSRESVYFISLVYRNENKGAADPAMMQQQRTMQQMQLSNALRNQVMEQLRQQADIKYSTKAL